MVTLTCEDASHLGGPMGSEYTTHVFTKIFSSAKVAKEYAVEFQGGFPDWAGWRKTRLDEEVCDSGAYIWTIKPVVVEK